MVLVAVLLLPLFLFSDSNPVTTSSTSYHNPASQKPSNQPVAETHHLLVKFLPARWADPILGALKVTFMLAASRRF